MRAARGFAAPAGTAEQDDAFFRCPEGRLKLRTIRQDAAESAVLISYRRPDAAGPKTSVYRTAPVADPAALRAVLAAACGADGVVRKRRLLFLHGPARIHFDEVEGLGRFIELEVGLQEGQTEADGAAAVQDLMRRLGIGPEDLVSGAYADQPAAAPVP